MKSSRRKLNFLGSRYRFIDKFKAQNGEICFNLTLLESQFFPTQPVKNIRLFMNAGRKNSP